ncbi:uncharacterized protein LOC112169340 isoform X3 [Rosa chinensis]|uniref:uncharacterized protein LOC112169340 isoform X3 n=1 Tax=Rosa chinensis TaxID=74649 RepID=UPI001AD92A67|nr:uncharacterized protein LOC112169340 isoform X3 [Rosa chinensis]
MGKLLLGRPPLRSKVIIMDADGTRSKAIARSLRKLGLKMPYLLQGGFRSWVKDGLRIKELKPETTLTILNETLFVAGHFIYRAYIGSIQILRCKQLYFPTICCRKVLQVWVCFGKACC